jgi:hypothetical protein
LGSIDSYEWEERSKKGELCRVMGCSNEPTTQGPKCLKHYCYQHLHGHGHIITDQTAEENKSRDERLR